MPAKKTASRKATAKKATAKRTTAKKATAKKATAKRTTAKKATAKRTTAKRKAATANKTTAKKTTARPGRAATPVRRRSSPMHARRGDVIVVDSSQVGSPPREGEVLRVIHGEVSVSYRVKWADGHETLISPAAGTLTVVRT